MDYTTAFRISASGMNVEKLRVDVTALNIANMHSTRSADGTVFKPMRVISGASRAPSFAAAFENASGNGLSGVQVLGIQPMEVTPRMVYEPSHPDANDKGFVAYPGINQAKEMVNLITALRAYEANVIAMTAAKTMAMKALDIGGMA
jgi:flagellar basal-body rod protein FlgC